MVPPHALRRQSSTVTKYDDLLKEQTHYRPIEVPRKDPSGASDALSHERVRTIRDWRILLIGAGWQYYNAAVLRLVIGRVPLDLCTCLRSRRVHNAATAVVAAIHFYAKRRPLAGKLFSVCRQVDVLRHRPERPSSAQSFQRAHVNRRRRSLYCQVQRVHNSRRWPMNVVAAAAVCFEKLWTPAAAVVEVEVVHHYYIILYYRRINTSNDDNLSCLYKIVTRYLI